jgi:hypothetical protein
MAFFGPASLLMRITLDAKYGIFPKTPRYGGWERFYHVVECELRQSLAIVVAQCHREPFWRNPTEPSLAAEAYIFGMLLEPAALVGIAAVYDLGQLA